MVSILCLISIEIILWTSLISYELDLRGFEFKVDEFSESFNERSIVNKVVQYMQLEINDMSSNCR